MISIRTDTAGPIADIRTSTMSVMVTGGTGFIGNRIVRKLLDRGEEVVCFDLAPPRANLESYLDRSLGMWNEPSAMVREMMER